MLKKIWSRIKLEHVAIIILIAMVWAKGRWKVPDPQIVTQTHIIEHFHDSVIYRDSFHVTTIKPTITEIPVQLQPSSNDSVLRRQYNDLLVAYASKQIVNDTLKVDTLGSVSVVDTIQYNSLKSRKWAYNFKEREKITTITIREPYTPKNQLYYGGELGWGTGSNNALNSADLGLMFKNKKDNIIKLGAGYNFTIKAPEIKIGYYQKLHFK